MQAVSDRLAERRRKRALKRLPFREVSDAAAGVDNLSGPVKAARLLTRYLVRAAGYRSAGTILRVVLRGFGPTRAGDRTGTREYVRYLLEVNRLRVEYLERLCAGDLHGAVQSKIRWAEHVIARSRSTLSRWDARNYLALLARHGHYAGVEGRCAVRIERRTDRKFYIYGPNAGHPPDEKYRDYTLVITKPVELDLRAFTDKMLFINSMYYAKLAREPGLRESIVREYGTIFVSCREAELSEPFVRSKFPLGGDIASAQGLGRVIYNLLRTYGRFTCVIEGFDMYVGKRTYAPYYPHLGRDSKAMVSERSACNGLKDHDALFNFLYVKELAGMLEVVDSLAFKRLVGLSGTQYLDELALARDFTSLC